MDQNVAAYRINIRTKKWWWAMFAFVIDVMVQNSWIIHRHANGKLDQLAFRREIVDVYLRKYKAARRFGRPPSTHSRRFDKKVPANIRLDGINHYSVSIPTQRRCAFCGMKTTIACSKCEVPLHRRCASNFHSS